ncbi:hypothetical protein M3Y99_00838900 [Aphelenchoides fujianensis]|nr:hypothetical protein M3Y99_00838900 [Aphelenchoides fujianensis]
MIRVGSRSTSTAIARAFRSTAVRPNSSTSSPAADGPKEEKPQAEAQRPLYATRRQFEKSRNDDRSTRVATEENGVKPSNFQRRLLVVTGLYKNKEQIPEYVGPQTMNRLADRTRVLFIVVGVLTFFTLCFVLELGTSRAAIRDRVPAREK